MPSIRFLDFSQEILIQEVTWIAISTFGSFTYESLAAMPFDKYDKVIKGVEKVFKRIKEDDDAS